MIYVIIMRGISGSGKSTFAKELSYKFKSAWLYTHTVSADDYFSKSGKYEFDPSKLGSAHNECLSDYLDELLKLKLGNNRNKEGKDSFPHQLIIVDNTNLCAAEIAPYYALAQMVLEQVHHKVVICNIMPNVNECADRSIHNVPIKQLMEMQVKQLCETASFMPWWEVMDRHDVRNMLKL